MTAALETRIETAWAGAVALYQGFVRRFRDARTLALEADARRLDLKRDRQRAEVQRDAAASHRPHTVTLREAHERAIAQRDDELRRLEAAHERAVADSADLSRELAELGPLVSSLRDCLISEYGLTQGQLEDPRVGVAGPGKPTERYSEKRLVETRSRIATIKPEIAEAEGAPIPNEDALARVWAEVDRLGGEYTPALGSFRARDPGARLDVTLPADRHASRDDTLTNLLAAVAPDALKELLATKLAESYGDREALSDHERTRRLAELNAELEQLEQLEERLIRSAESQGVRIARRPDASPAAVLMP